MGKNKGEGRGLVGTSTWREKEGEKGDPGAVVGSGPRPSAAPGRQRRVTGESEKERGSAAVGR
jgi:hypothetical protein